MNLFRRITASFTGSIESAVSQLENHEAVVHAALKDTRTMAAKAKVRLARVQKDGAVMQQKLDSLQAAERSWAERAIAQADQDNKAALECVRRRNHCQEQLAATRGRLETHRQQEKRLLDTVASIEARLQEIENTRNMLRTRQTTAEARNAVTRLETDSTCDLDDVIERWEMRILETEYAGPMQPETDSFEAEFEQQEDCAALEAQLAELVQKEGKEND